MKVVYHPRYQEVYERDPAAKAGRMESIVAVVSPHFELVTATSATVDDLKLVHSDRHIRYVGCSPLTYEIALLAVGGAIQAADLAVHHQPAFALIRPPGHHASRDHSWGFCFLNNMAVSIARLRQGGTIDSAAILDIDLHYGDGTSNIFANTSGITYCHPEGDDRLEYLDNVSRFLDQTKSDIIAVSAGFDRHEDDWGRLLTTEDYMTIGRLVKEYAEGVCQGKRYGVLEGGYNHSVLGANVKSLLEGMS